MSQRPVIIISSSAGLVMSDGSTERGFSRALIKVIVPQALCVPTPPPAKASRVKTGMMRAPHPPLGGENK